MFFVIIILFFLLISSVFLSNFKFGRFVIFIVSLLLLYAVFLLITYTPDKEYYTWWIDIPKFSVEKEPTFQLAAAFIRKNNYSYQFLHVSFISIYSFAFLYFVSKFNKNVLLITLLFVPLIFIFYGTQLRYFLGYYAVLLSFYYWIVDKNKVLAIACLVFGLASHYSLVLFLPFFFLMRIKQNFFSRMINLTVVILIGYTLLTTVIFQLFSGNHFLDYLKGDLVSSYTGGLFSFAPLIFVYIFVNIYYKSRLRLNPDLEHDEKFTFLYKMSLIPMIYIGIALSAQVIGHRVIMTGMLFPILLFFYDINKVESAKMKARYYFSFSVFLILVFIHFNFSVGLVLGEWEMVQEMNKMLKSNELIKYLIY